MTTTSVRFMAVTVSAVAIWLVAGMASPDEKQDRLNRFKEAAINSGCEAIPYPDEMKRCRETQDDVKNNICKDYGCDRERAEKLIEKLNEKRQNLKDAKDRNNESAIPDLERTIKEIEDELKEMKYDANVHRVGRGENCRSAREKVQEIFKEAARKINGESDTDSELDGYRKKILDHFEEERRRHEDHIGQVNNAIEKCKWVSSMSY